MGKRQRKLTRKQKIKASQQNEPQESSSQFSEFDLYNQVNKAYELSAEDINTSYNNLQNNLRRYTYTLRKYKKAYPDASDHELTQKLVNDYFDILAPLIFISSRNNPAYIEIKTAQELMKNDTEFSRIYDKVSNPLYEPNNEPYTLEDYKDSTCYKFYYVFKEIIDQLPPEAKAKTQELASNKNLSQDEKISQIDSYIDGIPDYTTEVKDAIKRHAHIYLMGPKESLTLFEKSLERKLRYTLSYSSYQIIKTLNSLGAYKAYSQKNRINFETLDFREFAIDSETNQSTYIPIDELPEALDKMSIDDLAILNSFWINRYAKELGNYSDALSTLYNTDILSQLLDGAELSDVLSLEEYTQLLIKKETLKPTIQEYILSRTRASNAENTSYGDFEHIILKCNNNYEFKYSTFGYKPLQELVTNPDYKFAYEQLFATLIPTSVNNPEDDILLYSKLLNPIICTYNQKDDIITTTLLQTIFSDNHRNVGIVPDSYSDDGTIGYFKNPMLTVCMDGNLTFFAKEHMSRSKTLKTLKEFKGNAMLPIYDGVEDFRQEGSLAFISSQLLLPFSEKQKEIVKKKLEELRKDPIKNKKAIKFMDHFRFLFEPDNAPEHFKTFDYDSNGNKTSKYEKRYIDLETGRIYYMKENGEFYPVKPQKQKNQNEGDERI